MSVTDQTTVHFVDSVAVDFTPITDSGDTMTDVQTVTLEDDPRTDFFETERFHQYQATVARPIEQTYTVGDGEQLTLKKPTEELQDSVWQIDNTPWTIGHPPSQKVTDKEQMRGFWSKPTYSDGQKATLNVPYDDEKAHTVIDETKSVSVGGRATVELTDSNGTLDGYQRNLVYDHIASVRKGRCSVEEGCGIHTDSAIDGRIILDGTQTMTTDETTMETKYSSGDWVQWSWNGGTANGKVKSTHTDGKVTVNGTTRDPTEKGEPVYKIKHWDDGSFGNMKIAYQSNLSTTDEPSEYSDSAIEMDGCSDGPCSCGKHVTPTNRIIVSDSAVADNIIITK
jgi:hypothetical protein